MRKFIKSDLPNSSPTTCSCKIDRRLQALPPDIVAMLEDALAQTAQAAATTLAVALNYGSQQEIARAAAQAPAAEGEITAGDDRAPTLDTADLPPLDLLIRTSGESPAVELPAVAGGLCRDVVHRRAVARFHPRRTWTRRWRALPAGSGALADGEARTGGISLTRLHSSSITSHPWAGDIRLRRMIDAGGPHPDDHWPKGPDLGVRTASAVVMLAVALAVRCGWGRAGSTPVIAACRPGRFCREFVLLVSRATATRPCGAGGRYSGACLCRCCRAALLRRVARMASSSSSWSVAVESPYDIGRLSSPDARSAGPRSRRASVPQRPGPACGWGRRAPSVHPGLRIRPAPAAERVARTSMAGVYRMMPCGSRVPRRWAGSRGAGRRLLRELAQTPRRREGSVRSLLPGHGGCSTGVDGLLAGRAIVVGFADLRTGGRLR